MEGNLTVKEAAKVAVNLLSVLVVGLQNELGAERCAEAAAVYEPVLSLLNECINNLKKQL